MLLKLSRWVMHKKGRQTKSNQLHDWEEMLCNLNCEFIFAKRRNNALNVIWVVESFEMTNHTLRHQDKKNSNQLHIWEE